MKIEALQPDLAPAAALAPRSNPGAFGRAVDALGALLDGASSAEDRFAAGRGSLQDAVYERARADVALAVATAAAQRGAQALQSLLNMQI